MFLTKEEEKTHPKLLRVCVLSLSALTLIAELSSQPAAPEKPVQKVVLISIDTLRSDFLGCYGSERNYTSNLNRFALENVLLMNATSQAPSTAISHKSILYSLYPSIHKTSRNHIPCEQLTSPLQALQSLGFKTAGFVGGGELSHKFGFSKGFDTYWEARTYSDTDAEESLRELERRVSEWLDQYYREKFFLLVHTYEVHCPYFPPKQYRDQFAGWYGGEIDPRGKCGDNYYNLRPLSPVDLRFVRDLYTAGIAYVDDFLGRLFEKLESLDVYDETLIIFLSDHGESLGERGYVGHNMLHNTQLQVPLILKIPGVPPTRVEAPVETIDVIPTVFSVLKIDPPYPFQGKNLISLISGHDSFGPGRPLISEQSGKVRVRRGDMVSIFQPNGDVSAEVYDLRTDPEELNNLAFSQTGFAKSCEAEYRKMLQQAKDLASKFVIEDTVPLIPDEQTQQQLRALGYIR
jgi:arylsulfatase A-like enzyme